MPTTTMWPAVNAAAMAAALLSLLATVLPARTSAAEPSAPKPAAVLDEEWDAAAATLVRRCDAAGHAELATLIRGWRLPAEEGRQFVFAIPSHTTRPDWIDTPDERQIWDDFRAARRTRAAGMLALAAAAARSDGDPAPRAGQPQPALAGTAEAIRLLYIALRDDPENERAREAGGWVRRRGEWMWPDAARRLDQNEEHSAEFGWLPRGRQERYRAGERYERGRWIRAEAAAVPTDPARGWRFSSDHWRITSTADANATALLAAQLEDAYVVWRQVFGGFQHEPAEWEQRLAGRGRPASDERRAAFAATLVADRRQYVAALERLEPTIARTLGIYWTPTHTAWFFVGEGQEPTTVHHEATHQLFAEMRRTSPLAGSAAASGRSRRPPVISRVWSAPTSAGRWEGATRDVRRWPGNGCWTIPSTCRWRNSRASGGGPSRPTNACRRSTARSPDWPIFS